MNHRLRFILFAAACVTLLVAVAVAGHCSSYPSGDPTVVTALAAPTAGGPIVYGPNTPMSGYPIRLERYGTTVAMWMCYLPPVPNCTHSDWCPPCPDPPGVTTIPLKEWCNRLDLLPMPSPALPTDKRPVCLPEWQ